MMNDNFDDDAQLDEEQVDADLTAAEGQLDAAPTSRLTSLRQRRQNAVKELHTDLEVPRLDPPVYVRFRPVTQAETENVNKRFAKSKDKDKTVLINAVLLAQACKGVYEIIDGEEVSVDQDDRHGDWPKFDDHLAGLLGLKDAASAADVVRGLYLTDPDVISTAVKLAEWSGFNLEAIEERQGN